MERRNKVSINLNKGVRTVYAKSFNDIRGSVKDEDFGDSEKMAKQAEDYDTQESATAK